MRPRDHPDVKANCFDVKHNSEQIHITLGPRLLISQLRGNQILLARNLDFPILMKSSVWAALSDSEEIKPGLLLVSVFLHEVQGPKLMFFVNLTWPAADNANSVVLKLGACQYYRATNDVLTNANS